MKEELENIVTLVVTAYENVGEQFSQKQEPTTKKRKVDHRPGMHLEGIT
jgi:hypothetical protein